MKKIFLRFICVILLASVTGLSQAQTYKFAAGVTGGFVLGLTTKNFISKKGAIELFLVSKYKGLVLGSLFTNHWDAFPDKRYRIFFGGGLHSGFFDGATYRNRTSAVDVFKGLSLNLSNYQLVYNLGMDIAIGIELNVNEYPFTLAVGYKPYFDLLSSDSKISEGFITVRYIFIRNNPYTSHFKRR